MYLNCLCANLAYFTLLYGLPELNKTYLLLHMQQSVAFFSELRKQKLINSFNYCLHKPLKLYATVIVV